MRRLDAIALVLAALSCAATPAAAGAIAVPLDQARIVTFKEPVATVYIGNPTIADITVIDSRRVFVLGKAFGMTNLIALDGKGHQIVNEGLSVYGRSANTVTLNRGASQVTYACAAARCETAPLPGDAPAVYQAMTSEAAQHQQAGEKAALASAQ